MVAARAELAEHGHAAISLRAVARRAGVSHAAPKHHFGDRAGLLTAVATDGFRALAEALERVVPASDRSGAPAGGPGRALADLGRAYVEFGLADPALFDLMFRPVELRPQDPALRAAQERAIGVLASTVAATAPTAPSGSSPGTPPVALISWALVHGLVVLTRDDALAGALGTDDPPSPDDLARSLIELFADRITAEEPPRPPGSR